MKLSFAIAAGVLCLASAAPAETLPPRDECAGLPGFSTFRDQLRDAVRRRDSDALIALTDEDIASSFGGDNGREEFIETWQLSSGADSPFWSEIEAVLSLGCSNNGEYAASPYLFGRFPDDRDGFSSLVATGTRIALRAGPTTSSPVLARLDWDLLTRQGDETESEWVPVRTDSGAEGYVHSSFVRSPIDYRAIFERTGTGWRMTAFIAGD